MNQAKSDASVAQQIMRDMMRYELDYHEIPSYTERHNFFEVLIAAIRSLELHHRG